MVNRVLLKSSPKGHSLPYCACTRNQSRPNQPPTLGYVLKCLNKTVHKRGVFDGHRGRRDLFRRSKWDMTATQYGWGPGCTVKSVCPQYMQLRILGHQVAVSGEACMA
ncbi:rCG23570, isoform CRA_c [Rattus norvegicus]|uniref:RCG23570, isoform CRA_c n=1 Tax=Rattus norvegicus TaxID=10116 RepID=A6KGY8_RAT|nr:rCG23570, isoform CRA_c [Rattus norvegicus]